MVRFAALGGAFLFVCACSGGPESLPPGGQQILLRDLGAVQAIHGVDGTTLADMTGKTIRVFGSYVADYGSTLSKTEALIGSMTFLDDGTGRIVVEFPNTSPSTYSPTGVSGKYESIAINPNSALDKFGTLTQHGEGYVFSIYIPARVGSNFETYFAAFGFETTTADRPATVSYSGIGALHLTDNTSGALTVRGTSSFEADFTSGEITGTLLDADESDIDVNGNGMFNDRLLVTITLENGMITDAGITGQASASGSTFIGGIGDPVDLEMSVQSSGAQGAFFGGAAESLAIIYGGDLTLNQPDVGVGDYSFSGLSTADQ